MSIDKYDIIAIVKTLDRIEEYWIDNFVEPERRSSIPSDEKYKRAKEALLALAEIDMRRTEEKLFEQMLYAQSYADFMKIFDSEFIDYVILGFESE